MRQSVGHDHRRAPQSRRYGELHRRRRRQLRLPPRSGDRLPRAQRRRQDDHDADPGRPDRGHRGQRHHRRPPLPGPAQPRAPRGRAARRRRPARRPHRARDPHPRRAEHGAAEVARRRDAPPGLAHRRGVHAPAAPLLPRHEAAPRHRARAAGRPAGADPRRAGQRPRPRRHPLDARAAQGLRRPRRHGAALEPPAQRGRADRRRDDPHRSGSDRGAGRQVDAARDAAASTGASRHDDGRLARRRPARRAAPPARDRGDPRPRRHHRAVRERRRRSARGRAPGRPDRPPLGRGRSRGPVPRAHLRHPARGGAATGRPVSRRRPRPTAATAHPDHYRGAPR